MGPPEPPPPYLPYSGSGAENSPQYRADQINEASKDIKRYYNRDLEICPYSHELLISIAETTDGLPPLAIFHHWNLAHVQSSTPALAPSSNVISAKLGHRELKLFHGLRDLGPSQLPAADVSNSDRIYAYLTALIDSSASSDSDNISYILSHLQNVSPSSSPRAGFVSVHLFGLVVHTNSSDALFSGGPTPAWKWFIPADPSSLMKRSSWKPDLEDLLTYPEWGPQGKRHLLLQGVGEERGEELRQGMILFPCSEENVTSHDNNRENSG